MRLSVVISPSPPPTLSSFSATVLSMIDLRRDIAISIGPMSNIYQVVCILIARCWRLESRSSYTYVDLQKRVLNSFGLELWPLRHMATDPSFISLQISAFVRCLIRTSSAARKPMKDVNPSSKA